MSADRTAQLRAHRKAFAYAVAHNITVAEANIAIARAGWAAIASRATSRRAAPAAPLTGPIIHPNEEPRQRLQWWQRD